VTGEVRDLQSRLAALTPAQQVKMKQRFQAMVAGEIPTPPFRCGHCGSQSMTKELADPKRPDEDDDKLRQCLQCGRRTKVTTLRRQRQLDVLAVVLADVR
jgi:DNA-directed RNA polymerase subunit M/transcription elongation factor TFIIS